MMAHERISRIFGKEKIEYFGVIPYAEARKTRPYLLERAGVAARSAIVFLVPYFTGWGENISAYAAVMDYHYVVGSMLTRLSESLTEAFPSGKFIGFTDHSPIDERAAALASGLGVLGKNGLIINEKYGSLVFLAAIFTDLDLTEGFTPSEPRYCINCAKCESACPTATLPKANKGEDDIPDCLSAITQKKGALTEREIALMKEHNTVWGCDICQKVCPYNKDIPITPIEEFRASRIPRLDKEILNSLSDEDFKKRAFSWRTRAVPERNLKAVYED